jgi:hypothetical protein
MADVSTLQHRGTLLHHFYRFNRRRRLPRFVIRQVEHLVK